MYKWYVQYHVLYSTMYLHYKYMCCGESTTRPYRSTGNHGHEVVNDVVWLVDH